MINLFQYPLPLENAFPIVPARRLSRMQAERMHFDAIERSGRNASHVLQKTSVQLIQLFCVPNSLNHRV